MWASDVTRVEARFDAAMAGVVFVAARLRRTLVDRPAIQEPSVRLAGPQSIVVGFVIDNHAAMTPALMHALTEIRSALDATGLPAAAALELASVAVLARGPGHRQPWSWEDFRQTTADREELTNVLRWPRALQLWTTLARSVEDATRTADAHARLDEALRRLG
ncbi:MAG TPA: hypothetical protein VMU20_12265 [Candidatus Dormibacteraeota bacterium]|nr:hypothetical protein [Candidatus Dormibacteraeota bacterium]